MFIWELSLILNNSIKLDWGLICKTRKCVQLTGGPLVPDVPLAPVFPFRPWSTKSSCFTVLACLHDRKGSPIIMPDTIKYSLCSNFFCPYLITFGSFRAWFSLWPRKPLKWWLLFYSKFPHCVWRIWHYICVLHFKGCEFYTYRRPWTSSFTSLSINTLLSLI